MPSFALVVQFRWSHTIPSGAHVGSRLLASGFSPPTAAPEVIQGFINDMTRPEEEIGEHPHDPQQADIFSVFTIIMHLLHGKYPATWTPEEFADEDTEFEDMERAISVYSDPTVSPTYIYMLTSICSMHCSSARSTITSTILLLRQSISMCPEGVCPRMEPHLPSISTR